MKERILFICTGNSARSQMAEALINHFYTQEYVAFSAGTHPTQVNPLAIKVMKEIGIDISQHRSKGIDELMEDSFYLAVTVCDAAQQTCPFVSTTGRQIHKGFTDPAAAEGDEEQKLMVFRQVRDDIHNWIDNSLIPKYF